MGRRSPHTAGGSYDRASAADSPRPILAPRVQTSIVGVVELGPASLTRGRGNPYRMRLTVAAIGAIAAALLEVTILPELRIGGVQPDLVLIAAVVWTFLVGFEGALVWAFVGGLMLDVLTGRPLGSTAFALLICVGAAAALARVLDPARALAPAIAMFPLAILYTALPLVVSAAVRGPLTVPDPVASVAPRVIADTLLAALVGGFGIWSRSRRPARERIEW